MRRSHNNQHPTTQSHSYCGEIIDGGCEGIECNGAIGQWSCYASSDSDNTDQGGDGVASSIPCAFIALVEDRCWTCTSCFGLFARALGGTH